MITYDFFYLQHVKNQEPNFQNDWDLLKQLIHSLTPTLSLIERLGWISIANRPIFCETAVRGMQTLGHTCKTDKRQKTKAQVKKKDCMLI
jgi:hypothetical protein